MNNTELSEQDFQVVVAGSGAAGLTGALTAAIAGLKVLLVEKTELIGGTSSISGGGVWIPANPHTAESGIEDSPDEAMTYLRHVVGDEAGEGMLESFVYRGREMIEFLEDRAALFFRAWPAMGGTIDYQPDLPGGKPGGRALDSGKVALADVGEWAECVRFGPGSPWAGDKFDFYRESMHARPSGKGAFHPGRAFVDVGNVEYADAPKTFSHVAGGTALVVQLLRGCIEQGVVFAMKSPVRDLVVDDGRVVGVRLERDGEEVVVRASRGVLLATGGFAHNEDMKRAYFDRHLDLSCEIRTNQGDGQRAGAAAGAQLSHMGDAWWMPMVALGDNATPEQDAFSVREARCLPHTMVVDHSGRRFINESLNYYNFCEGFGIKRGMTSPRTAWLVFDSQAHEKYSMFNGAPPPPPGKGRSWLHEAPTLDELAAKIGVDPATLVETATRFSGYARDGRDPEFGRGEGKFDRAWGDPAHEPSPALGPIEVGPFFAVELRPGALATKGGLKINTRAEVLRAGDGAPIPGLYAAGNASAGPVPYAYPGPGSTLGAGMTFGFIAAHSMAETQLSTAASAIRGADA